MERLNFDWETIFRVIIPGGIFLLVFGTIIPFPFGWKDNWGLLFFLIVLIGSLLQVVSRACFYLSGLEKRINKSITRYILGVSDINVSEMDYFYYTCRIDYLALSRKSLNKYHDHLRFHYSRIHHWIGILVAIISGLILPLVYILIIYYRRDSNGFILDHTNKIFNLNNYGSKEIEYFFIIFWELFIVILFYVVRQTMKRIVSLVEIIIDSMSSKDDRIRRRAFRIWERNDRGNIVKRTVRIWRVILIKVNNFFRYFVEVSRGVIENNNSAEDNWLMAERQVSQEMSMEELKQTLQ